MIPLISATRTVRSKVDQMRQNMEDQQSTFSTNNGSTINSGNTGKKNPPTTSQNKGDYIDFEEVK